MKTLVCFISVILAGCATEKQKAETHRREQALENMNARLKPGMNLDQIKALKITVGNCTGPVAKPISCEASEDYYRDNPSLQVNQKQTGGHWTRTKRMKLYFTDGLLSQWKEEEIYDGR